MSDSVFVGTKAGGLETSPQFEPISKIILLVDSENYYEAGNDTGRTLEITCPYGTQAMANNLLSSLGGYAYQPATATDALIDPAAELGDAVTVGGIYTVLAQMDTTFDSLMTADIGAPGQEEIESEYPYVSQQQSDINRQIAQTRSEISKTSEEIGLRVDGLENQYAQLKVTIDGVTIEGPGGTTLIDGGKIDADELHVNAANIDGTLSANQINADELHVNAANIDGTLSANQINMTGSITWEDLASDAQGKVNSAQSTATNAQTTANSARNTANKVSNRVSAWTYPGSTQINGSSIMTGTVTASTLRGGTVELLDNSGSTAGEISLSSASSASYAVDIDSYGAMRLQCNGNLYLTNGGASMTLSAAEDVAYFNCTVVPNGNDRYLLGTSPNRWADVYCQTGAFNGSDENIKNSIEELPEKYITFIDNVIPRRFKYNDGTSNRYHAGFTAQNVKAAMDAAGISDLEFAGWAKDVDAAGDDTYLLRYTEFLAPMLLKIRQQEERIENLENAIKELRQ